MAVWRVATWRSGTTRQRCDSHEQAQRLREPIEEASFHADVGHALAAGGEPAEAAEDLLTALAMYGEAGAWELFMDVIPALIMVAEELVDAKLLWLVAY